MSKQSEEDSKQKQIAENRRQADARNDSVTTKKAKSYDTSNTPVKTVSDEQKEKLKATMREAKQNWKTYYQENFSTDSYTEDPKVIRKFEALNVEMSEKEFDAYSVMPPVFAEESRWKSGNSALSRDEAIVARKDMLKRKDFYVAIAVASIGTSHDSATHDTPVDTLYNKDKSIYSVFEPTRQMLRDKYGDEITLYRAGTQATKKATINMTSEKSQAQKYAEIYGTKVSSVKVPVDKVLAVNISRDGGYEEFIILNDRR